MGFAAPLPAHEADAKSGGMVVADDAGARLATPEGMTIAITSPADGARFAVDDPVRIEVSYDGFDVAGDHWHLYVNGQMYAMVGAGRTAYEIGPGVLSTGEQTISVTISNAAHEEYELEPTRTIIVGE
uniref:DUF4399 domain-containing protein n=1 Tax=Haliea sp. ETY-M TaxID=1055105 RepID=A0A455R2Z8_9GAMM|nr:hypothetical protein [Haliea sp. ETY-M]